jgi:ubiquinone/menaquinone biosynthesis C-methylase UbiE
VNATVGSFDTYVERYDAWFRRSPGRSVFQSELSAIRSLLVDVPRPWLEVGVGTGVFGRALGAEVGLDPSREALRRARRRGINAVQGVGQALPFPDSTFGGVFLIVTLCFVGQPSPLLAEAARLLRPDGALLLADIERESPWGRLYRQYAAEGHPLYHLATFWATNELVEMLKAAGLEVRAAASTLRRGPTERARVEKPASGIVPGAGFVCLLARQTCRQSTTPGSP